MLLCGVERAGGAAYELGGWLVSSAVHKGRDAHRWE